MSKFRNTLKSKYYWTAKGQGKIYSMLNDQITARGDSAKLAKKIDSTPGYVSQILSGDAEINPTWKKIVKFCLALDKVPILEIKDLDEYLLEENLKASYSKYEKMFHQTCQIPDTHNVSELKNPDHPEINDFSFLLDNRRKLKIKSEPSEYMYDEYELI